MNLLELKELKKCSICCEPGITVWSPKSEYGHSFVYAQVCGDCVHSLDGIPIPLEDLGVIEIDIDFTFPRNYSWSLQSLFDYQNKKNFVQTKPAPWDRDE